MKYRHAFVCVYMYMLQYSNRDYAKVKFTEASERSIILIWDILQHLEIAQQ